MPNVKFFQTSSITVKSDPPTDIDFDGEIYGTTPAAVKILPLALNVISLVK